MRGIFGAAGSLGVCTRMAIRLHPWPGPTDFPTYGQHPAYKADWGPNFKCYTLCYPDWEGFARATQYFHESNVLYSGHRQFNMFGRDLKAAMIEIISNPDGQLADMEGLLNDEYIKEQNEKMKIDHQVCVVGFSEKDMEYKEKAIDYILEQTGGWKSEMMLEKDKHDYALAYMTRLGHKNLNFVYCGAYEGVFGLSNNVWKTAEIIEEATALKIKWEQETNYLVQSGGDSSMGNVSSIGGGGATGWEFFTHFDAYDKESIRGCKELSDACQEFHNKYSLGPDFCRWNSDVRHMNGYSFTQEEHNEMFKRAPQPWIFGYQFKIREAINPKNLCGAYFRTADPACFDN